MPSQRLSSLRISSFVRIGISSSLSSTCRICFFRVSRDSVILALRLSRWPVGTTHYCTIERSVERLQADIIISERRDDLREDAKVIPLWLPAKAE